MKIILKNDKEYIFDIVRKKYIINTPEEWVRQHTIKFLNTKKGYPTSLMSIEKKTTINNISKRCDIICYNNNNKPILLVECKSQNVKLNKETIHQSLNYQKVVKAKYIMITNGTNHFCFYLESDHIKFLKQVPSYRDLTII
tara:strand:+ start:145 stop:567 length:423 start_codon:yes stop_codon:yes gene_type:complete